MTLHHRIVLAALAGLGAVTSAPVLAQPMGGGMMRDPYGELTIPRKNAEAQAAAGFAAMDANKDGMLSVDELRAARPAPPPRSGGDGPPAGPDRGGRGGPDMDRMARMMDANGDGKVMRDEFIAGTLRRFDLMDADHDGNLTKAERQEAMRARMEARMRTMMGGNGD